MILNIGFIMSEIKETIPAQLVAGAIAGMIAEGVYSPSRYDQSKITDAKRSCNYTLIIHPKTSDLI